MGGGGGGDEEGEEGEEGEDERLGLHFFAVVGVFSWGFEFLEGLLLDDVFVFAEGRRAAVCLWI